MVLLIGIVVNNAILLIEYIERGLLEGLPLNEAVARAGRIRLRPILMTVLTTVFGMLPLALGMGSGAALMQPLAIAVIGGLMFSTVLTLLIAPCLFVIVRSGADRLSSTLFEHQRSGASAPAAAAQEAKGPPSQTLRKGGRRWRPCAVRAVSGRW